MVEINQNVEPTNQHAIELFQRFIGKKLPKDYVKFLVDYNGGSPVPDAFDFEDGSGGSSVRYFHGLRKNADDDDLLRNMDVYKDRMPTDFLPIASDFGGNKIVMAISGQYYGRVFFWDHENEVDEGSVAGMQNMSLVAKNFSAFLSGLHA
jgi:hypothetical protein